MTQDWTWNKDAYSKTAWFSSHSLWERAEHDYYATEPRAVELLLERESFWDKIFECACGEWHLSEEMIRLWKDVFSSDLIDRGYWAQKDFLTLEKLSPNYDIITNPPYKYANNFIEKAMDLLWEGKKLALFLPIRYLEGKARKKLFEKYPPLKVYVSSWRLSCAKNGDFDKMKWNAVCYSWFIRQKWYEWKTILERFN